MLSLLNNETDLTSVSSVVATALIRNGLFLHAVEKDVLDTWWLLYVKISGLCCK